MQDLCMHPGVIRGATDAGGRAGGIFLPKSCHDLALAWLDPWCASSGTHPGRHLLHPLLCLGRAWLGHRVHSGRGLPQVRPDPALAALVGIAYTIGRGLGAEQDQVPLPPPWCGRMGSPPKLGPLCPGTPLPSIEWQHLPCPGTGLSPMRTPCLAEPGSSQLKRQPGGSAQPTPTSS